MYVWRDAVDFGIQEIEFRFWLKKKSFYGEIRSGETLKYFKVIYIKLYFLFFSTAIADTHALYMSLGRGV